MLFNCFASTNQGLEELLTQELEILGANNFIKTNAGIKFKANFKTIMLINLNCRLASRILIEVGSGYYNNENDIYDIVYKINWFDWFNVNLDIKVATNAIDSPLKSLNFITLKVKDAICDKFAAKFNKRPNVNKINPNIRIFNFLTSNHITIYLDTSGEALFKRGYRNQKQEAPFKENLAAGLIKLTNWQPQIPLLDPMCGSGTIIIEAVMYGLNIAPGLFRSFSFEKLNIFEKSIWQELINNAKDNINNKEKLKLYANDLDRKSIDITENNLKNLPLRVEVNFTNKNFLDLPSPQNGGILLTNPPYGIRLEELTNFYPLLSKHLKHNYYNWNCFFITSELDLPKMMRLKPSRKIPLRNGDLICRLFEFKMVQGSNR